MPHLHISVFYKKRSLSCCTSVLQYSCSPLELNKSKTEWQSIFSLSLVELETKWERTSNALLLWPRAPDSSEIGGKPGGSTSLIVGLSWLFLHGGFLTLGVEILPPPYNKDCLLWSQARDGVAWEELDSLEGENRGNVGLQWTIRQAACWIFLFGSTVRSWTRWN